MGILPRSPVGWVILIVAGYVVFKTTGAAAAGAAAGHWLHNAGTFITSALSSL